MSGPWEDYAPAKPSETGPWNDYAPAKKAAPPKKRTWLVDDVKDAVVGAATKLGQDEAENFSSFKARGGKPAPLLEDYSRGARRLGDVASVALSPLMGIQNAFTRPAAEAVEKTGLPIYEERGFLDYSKGIPRPVEGREARASAFKGVFDEALMGARPAQTGGVGAFGGVAGPSARKPSPPPRPPSRIAERASAFDRANVDPNIASTAGGYSAKAANFSAENLVGFRPRAALAKQQTQAGAEADRLARSYGDPRGAQIAGETVGEGVKRFAKGEIGTGRTMPVAPDLARLKSSQKLTFGDKSESLYLGAERLIGDVKAPIELPRTRAALNGALNRFNDPNLNARFKNTLLEGIGQDLTAAGGQATWGDAAALRTNIRTRLMADPQLRATVDDAQVNAIYSALTDDMATGAAKLGGPEAARAWSEANRYYRKGMERIGGSLQAFSGETGERAYSRIWQAAGSGSAADADKLLSLKRSLSADEWGDVTSTALKQMGRPTKGAPELIGDDAFSVNTFLTNYNSLSPRGKDILFGSVGGGGAKASALRSDLDNLAGVVADLKAVQKGANASNSGTAMQGVGTVGGLITFREGAVPALLGIAGTGEIVTNPGVLKAYVGLVKAARTSRAAYQTQLGRLEQISRANAQFLPLYQAALALQLTEEPAPQTAAQPARR